MFRSITITADRCVKFYLLFTMVGVLLCFAMASTARGEAVLNPNQLIGTISFNNVNPQILQILSANGV